MITVGQTSTRKNHRVHLHANGWAICGAGRLLTGTSHILGDADAGRICKTCSRIRPLSTWIMVERDNMDARRMSGRARMLDTILDSLATPAEISEREAFFAEMTRMLTQPSASPARVATESTDSALVLF